MTDDNRTPSRGFKVSARTILQLGGELISSDGVAFYELIKNAVDASSPSVTVEVVSRLPFDAIARARHQLAAKDSSLAVSKTLKQLAQEVIPDSPGANDLIATLQSCDDSHAAGRLLDEANSITFCDSGDGMSMADLEGVYLHVGTPSRLNEKRQGAERRILGEKGIGRLSVMRLGSLVAVTTSRNGESSWNELRIDWRDFERDLDDLLEEIPVAPRLGGEKIDPAESGTTIRISSLRSDWTQDKLRQLAITDLARARDPFGENSDFRIDLRFNDRIVLIEGMNAMLFEDLPHAVVTAKMTVRGKKGPILTGDIDYRLHNRQQQLSLEINDLLEAAGGVKPHVLEDLGAFELKFYWFNRQILDPIEGLGNVKQVRDLIKQWSGGLMVYRDGFRIPPYGGPEDDWLDLDRTALSYKSYKVNRAQLIGKVDITSRGNPKLIDQTNREGLADCPEKEALISVLKNLIRNQFRPFLNEVDEQVSLQSEPTFKDIESRFADQEALLASNISRLRALASQHNDAGLKTLAQQFSEQANEITGIIKDVGKAQGNIEQRQERLMELAGLGLMVEIVAHELNRSVVHTLKGLASAVTASADNRLTSLLRSAEAQLRSLQKRISVLDRLSISGRQRKSAFDPIEVVNEVFEGRAEQFDRHNIRANIELKNGGRPFSVKMVKGIFYQVIENLVENSVYWLKSEKELNPGFEPTITVRLDATSSSLFFSDNGPGIDPVNANRVFVPFFSLKKKERGKGLGLYIAQEYARDQSTALTLSKHSTRPDGRLNTFIFDLSGAVKE